MSQYAELEELEAVLTIQELLAFGSVDISECLGDKFDKSAHFQKPTTVKTRQSTAWSVNVYRAWAEYQNTQLETLGDEYRSVPVDLGTTLVDKVNYWLTRFLLEVMKDDGNSLLCSIHSLVCSIQSIDK